MRLSERLVLAIGSSLLMLSCAGKHVLAPGPAVAMLKTAHWVPLDFPDSKVTPGSVVANDANVGVRWLGHVRECGVPDSVLSVVQGNIGDATIKRDATYDAKVVLNIKGVQAGPEFGRVSNAVLNMNGTRADSIDLIRLQVWLSDPANQAKIAQACNDILKAPNAYLVQESFYVGNGKYTLTDNTNGKVAEGGPTVVGS